MEKYNFEYRVVYTELNGNESGGVMLLDCSTEAWNNLAPYEIYEMQALSKELHEKDFGSPSIFNLLRVLVHDDVLEKSHYLISATWG
jgi:hypothetical protein